MSELTAGFCVARTDASQVINVVGIYNGLTAMEGAGGAWDVQPAQIVIVVRKSCTTTTERSLFTSEVAAIGETLDEIGVEWTMVADLTDLDLPRDVRAYMVIERSTGSELGQVFALDREDALRQAHGPAKAYDIPLDDVDVVEDV